MDTERWPRDAQREEFERDAYTLLHHVYEVTGASADVSVDRERAANELDLAPTRATQLAAYLTDVGLLTRGEGSQLFISHSGIAYVAQLAWRRCSVRVAWDDAAPWWSDPARVNPDTSN